MADHKWHNPCLDRYGDFHTYCQWCDGGLECCSECGAFEGATPDQCPGEQMSADRSDLVYKGEMNYRDGQWRIECCEAMRHMYDKENYMREKGYEPGPPHPLSGNETWIKLSS